MNPRNVRLYAWDRSGWDDKRWELVPGVIDETASWVFTHGHCHSLALALHEHTGWEMVGGGGGWGDAPGHVAVLTPEGDVLDIDGVSDVDDWSYKYGDVTPVEPDDAYNAFWGEYRKPRVDAARHWVEPVLAEYSYHQEVYAA